MPVPKVSRITTPRTPLPAPAEISAMPAASASLMKTPGGRSAAPALATGATDPGFIDVGRGSGDAALDHRGKSQTLPCRSRQLAIDLCTGPAAPARESRATESSRSAARSWSRRVRHPPARPLIDEPPTSRPSRMRSATIQTPAAAASCISRVRWRSRRCRNQAELITPTATISTMSVASAFTSGLTPEPHFGKDDHRQCARTRPGDELRYHHIIPRQRKGQQPARKQRRHDQRQA
jgi:hypothetical protein